MHVHATEQLAGIIINAWLVNPVQHSVTANPEVPSSTIHDSYYYYYCPTKIRRIPRFVLVGIVAKLIALAKHFPHYFWVLVKV